MNRRSAPAAPFRPGGFHSGTVIGLLAFVTIATGIWWPIKRTDNPAPTEPAAPAAAVTSTAPVASAKSNNVTVQTQSEPREQILRRRFQQALGQYLGSTQVADREIRALLTEFRFGDAFALLEEKAAAGSFDALILLWEAAETCAWRMADGSKRTRSMRDEGHAAVRASARFAPAGLQQGVETALAVDHQWSEAWLGACQTTNLNRGEISRQLRETLRARADAGDTTSLRRLAELAGVTGEGQALLLSAAKLGDRAAQVALAETYYFELTHDRKTEHLEQMIYWLEISAKHSPQAQYLLGKCRLDGCDGRPADIEGGLSLLRSAARQGDAFALKALADTIPVGTGTFTNVEQYAWLEFERNMLESSCVIPMSYAFAGVDNWQRMQDFGRSLSPFELSSAQALGAQYWREQGPATLKSFTCG